MAINVLSQSDLRFHNEKRILEHIRRNPGATQLEIARGIGLTRAAVAKLLGSDSQDELGRRDGAKRADRGDAERLNAVLDTAGTKNPRRYWLAAKEAAVFSLDLGAHHVRLKVTDLQGDDLPGIPEDRHPDVLNDPSTALDVAADMLRTALALSRDKGIANVAGIVVGVPFPVNAAGTVLGRGRWRPFAMPGALLDRLDKLDVPVIVESDANLGAIAEHAELENEWVAAQRHGEVAAAAAPAGPPANLLYIKWSADISAAWMISGELHRGDGGLAGNLAYTNATAASGSRTAGSLNDIASIRAVVDGLDDADTKEALLPLGTEEKVRVLIARARGGDADVRARLQEAATALGAGLGAIVNAVDPGRLIIGGAVHSVEYEYLAPWIWDGLEETTYPPLLEALTIEPGRVTGRAAVEGGKALALKAFAVAHLLEHRDEIAQRPRTRQAKRRTG